MYNIRVRVFIGYTNNTAAHVVNSTYKLFVTSCYELVVINLLTTCYVQTISDLLEQLVASLLTSSTLLQDDNNLFQTCQQLGTSSANTS
jgi:hypothetical protein